MLSAVELEERKAALQAEVVALESRIAREKADALASIERAVLGADWPGVVGPARRRL